MSRIEDGGRRAAVYQGDLATVDAQDALPAAARELGDVALLVNNAGVTLSSALDELTREAWDRATALNLTAPAWLATALARDLTATHGAIVNVGSTGGITGSVHSLPYSATKAGLIGVTKTLARMLAPEVRVNLVAPGIIDTDLLVGISPQQSEQILGGQLLPRLGRPEDIARAVLDVAGWEFATGQVVVVDGGRVL